MVSRKHSLIRMESGRYVDEDLGSTNGTHVNDVRVAKQALQHNDVVRCGSLWLRYVEEGPVAQPQPPPVPTVPPLPPPPHPTGGSAQPSPKKKGGTQRLAAESGNRPAPPQPASGVP